MATIGKRYKADQIVNLLHEMDVLTANGKAISDVPTRVEAIHIRAAGHQE